MEKLEQLLNDCSKEDFAKQKQRYTNEIDPQKDVKQACKQSLDEYAKEKEKQFTSSSQKQKETNLVTIDVFLELQDGTFEEWYESEEVIVKLKYRNDYIYER